MKSSKRRRRQHACVSRMRVFSFSFLTQVISHAPHAPRTMSQKLPAIMKSACLLLLVLVRRVCAISLPSRQSSHPSSSPRNQPATPPHQPPTITTHPGAHAEGEEEGQSEEEEVGPHRQRGHEEREGRRPDRLLQRCAARGRKARTRGEEAVMMSERGTPAHKTQTPKNANHELTRGCPC